MSEIIDCLLSYARYGSFDKNTPYIASTSSYNDILVNTAIITSITFGAAYIILCILDHYPVKTVHFVGGLNEK